MRRRNSKLVYLISGVSVAIVLITFFELQPSEESVPQPKFQPAPNRVERIVEHVQRERSPNCAKRHEQLRPGCLPQRASGLKLPEACWPVMENRGISRKMSRYVLALNYSEQQHTAVDNLLHLSGLAGEWKARVVMPFTADSQLIGLPRHDGSAAPLEFLLDKQHLDNLSCSYNLPPFVTFRDFLLSAGRKAIVLHFVYSSEMGNDTDSKKIVDKIRQTPVVECSEFLQLQGTVTGIVKTLERESSKVLKPGFRVAKVVCINASHPTTPGELVAKSQLMDFSTVFVTNWRRISIVYDEREERGLHLATQHEVPGATRSNYTIPYFALNYLRPSRCVTDATSHFLKTIVSSQPFVAIHFHSQNLGQADWVTPGYFKNCFARAMQLGNKILGHDSLLPVCYFTDYGSCGSQTCEHCRGAIMLDAAIMIHGLSVTEFKPNYYNTWCDTGFIASVELDAVSRAKYLILVGGGLFQGQARQRAILEKNLQAAFTVCWDDSSANTDVLFDKDGLFTNITKL